MKHFAPKKGYSMLIGLSAIAVCLLVLVGVLLAMSPGTPSPVLDRNGKPLPGAIAEKLFLTIGGVKQGMFIKSRDATNPVLLYLHGGMPDYFLTGQYPTGLEDYFTVVWWEQRGSGLSYRADIPAATMTLEQVIADTREVTNYLRRRFAKEKIFLMGHSGGTFIGILAAAQAPELYHAYCGVAQMSDQRQSERLAYEYMLARFTERNNAAMVGRLRSAPVTATGDIPAVYLALRDKGMHSLGVGTTHEMRSVITGILWPSLTCREYTATEKINMWRGKSRAGVSVLWGSMLATDLATVLPELEIPIYFFHGIHDYTVSYALAKSYFGKLKAPVKGFYTFEHSAHSPLFEEPGKMRHVLQTDVLAGRNSLSDVQ
jgi:pimeloyl-ACP methyl ester carboxylesterase